MKKLFFIAVLALSLTVTAQTTRPIITPNTIGNMLSTPTHSATDTITNTTVKYQYAVAKGANITFTAQALVTKVTGTVAGTVKIQGSLDGTNYNDLAGQTAFTLTDVASQSASFSVNPSTHQFYRIVVTPSGTQSSRIATKALARQ